MSFCLIEYIYAAAGGLLDTIYFIYPTCTIQGWGSFPTLGQYPLGPLGRCRCSNPLMTTARQCLCEQRDGILISFKLITFIALILFCIFLPTGGISYFKEKCMERVEVYTCYSAVTTIQRYRVLCSK